MLEQIEANAPGWIDGQLSAESAMIDARLRKRYIVPFDLPAPQAVQLWLVHVVTMSCALRRGIDATDEQFQEIKARADAAKADILEAANSSTGLFDLPLATGKTAISSPTPLGKSDASPYVWTDRQGRAGREQDNCERWNK